MAPVGMLARLKSMYTKQQGMSILSVLGGSANAPKSVRTDLTHIPQMNLHCRCIPSFCYRYVYSVTSKFKLLADLQPDPSHITLCGPLLSVSSHAALTQPQPGCAVRDSRAHPRGHSLMYHQLLSCTLADCRGGQLLAWRWAQAYGLVAHRPG